MNTTKYNPSLDPDPATPMPAQAQERGQVVPAPQIGLVGRVSSPGVPGPASWAQVKYWATNAGKFAQASLACQVMAGFALAELHKKHGIRPGNKTGKNQIGGELPSDLVIPTWPELVKQNAGISDETARNWMAMAGGIKSRWKKLAPQERLRELMRVPVSDWTDADTKLVGDALVKVTDGATQMDFLRELGLAKKIPRGTGREPGCDGTNKKLTLSEQVALMQQQAREDWAAAAQIHAAYKAKFIRLPDEDVTAQIAVLERDLNARRAWIKQPLNARNPKAIEEMFA